MTEAGRKGVWMSAGLLALTLALAPAVIRAAGGHDHGKMTHKMEKGKQRKQGKSVTLQGEIIDMACYMAHEGKGKKHRKCAKTCVLGGVPAGLLTADGSVYLLLENHGNKIPYKQAAELAGRKAEITGKKYVRGGLPAIVVEKVKKL